MLPVLKLDWHRCPDGVEGDQAAPRALPKVLPKGTIYSQVAAEGGRYFHFKSNRGERFSPDQRPEGPGCGAFHQRPLGR